MAATATQEPDVATTSSISSVLLQHAIEAAEHADPITTHELTRKLESYGDYPGGVGCER
ncbi:hypothetical protein H0G86_000064 [Trichoderma simmonsii]|uniref:Uncharacterized protein n=1 Tax=Trichoderma simmonsii TaxID=1491479 RepID=A0A8G0P937_9HYPO|nr:hypothetical protein H0G86_000064 [Trichoderma simmonsii]